jgi:uncharacterized ferritin-like protein (DUF455 family)
MATASLFREALAALLVSDPERKGQAVEALQQAFLAGGLRIVDDPGLPCPVDPGRPAHPVLVPPSQLPRRSMRDLPGRASMLHAIAHIEFSAINLALDAVQRFRAMPPDYYRDWLRVAMEEVRHFRLLRQRLADFGYRYGDFAAHDGLWDMARKTAADPLSRMAIVPRVLEARGLDVNPGIQRAFRSVGDGQTVELLQIILDDEVGHVAIGNRWFHHLCEQRGEDPEACFFRLLDQYLGSEIRCPLHRQARRQAGFSERELDRLQALCR